MCLEPELDPIFDPEELKHDQAIEHLASVQPATIFTKDDATQAVCTCGWTGRINNYDYDSERDARLHLLGIDTNKER